MKQLSARASGRDDAAITARAADRHILLEILDPAFIVSVFAFVVDAQVMVVSGRKITRDSVRRICSARYPLVPCGILSEAVRACRLR